MSDRDDTEELPRVRGVDSTLGLFRDGYAFIARRCDRLGTDGFRVRLMGREAVCLRGPEAFRLVYEGEGLTREGAMPGTVLRLLQDKGSVQQMEGAAHRRRKALFTELLVEGPAADEIAAEFRALLLDRAAAGGRMAVLEETSVLLGHAVCRWAGLPEEIAGDADFQHVLFEMSDRTGCVGPATMRALLRRRRAERRLAGLIRDVRAGRVEPGSALSRISAATDEDSDRPLPVDVVVVELLNILRPTVAIGRYIAFAVHALATHPEWWARLRDGDDATRAAFAEEVRRLYPFFPFAAAIAERPVRWRGLDLPAGQWILADIYGTTHDGRFFPEPDAFRPARGLDWRAATDRFVPQGAGRVAETHRCPGERVTVTLMEEALKVLTRDVSVEVPEQDLSIRLSRIPARPADGMLLDLAA